MATFKYYRDFDEIDGIRYANLDESLFNASPTVRINYNLKVSIPKKIKTDIYIDRGNGTSFSRHFALGECKSLEALTQYQDGGLKIINNNDVNTLYKNMSAGVYGMNVPNSLQENKYGIWIVIAISMILSAFGVFLFKRKRWF